jgi:hypothetical protein
MEFWSGECPNQRRGKLSPAGGTSARSISEAQSRLELRARFFRIEKTLSTRCFKTTAWANYEKLELNNKKSAFLRKRGRTVLLGFH